MFKNNKSQIENQRSKIEDNTLTSVVEELCASNHEQTMIRKNLHNYPLPSREVVVEIIEHLRSVLFPGYFGNSEIRPDSIRFYVGSTLDKIMHTMHEQVKRGLCFICEDYVDHCPECERQAHSIMRTFLTRLPEVQQMLAKDVKAAYEGDPAATSPNEAIFCYPGVLALTNYRLVHELYVLKVPLIPRMITEYAHGITGIDIHPGAKIGEGIFIDHGTGVVIGETCIIGNGVRLYQGVTLGAKSFPLDAEGKPIKGIERHPIVEDDVIIYSGATILGRVVIGRGSVIGGNVWLTEDVPPFSHITQAGARHEDFENGGGI